MQTTDWVKKLAQDTATEVAYADTLMNSQHESTGGDMAKYRLSPYAGHVMRTDQGVQQMNVYPPWVVPMCAGFSQPYVNDWLQSFQNAIAYVHEHTPDQAKTKSTILLLVDSNGGDTDLLGSMTDAIDAAFSLPENADIELVALVSGHAASCAFVFAMHVDKLYLAPGSKMMCHEPALCTAASPNNMTSTTREDAERQTSVLQKLQTELYDSAEKNMFKRYARNAILHQPDQAVRDVYTVHQKGLSTGGPAHNIAITYWRKHWIGSHSDVATAFYRECFLVSAVTTPDPPKYNTAENVFKYVTSKLARDTHHLWISAEWMWKFGFADLPAVVMSTERSEQIKIVIANEFVTTI